jgi:hypothetical protein
MSKAEDRAEEYCNSTLVGSPYIKKMAYLEGYHQAEKDLELTWEDMLKIDEIISEVYKNSDSCQTEVIYQEVLKRFKAQKGK